MGSSVASLSAPFSLPDDQESPVASLSATAPFPSQEQGVQATVRKAGNAAGNGDHQAYSYLTYNGKTYYIRHIKDGEALGYSADEWNLIKEAVTRSLAQLKTDHPTYQENFHSGHLDPTARTWSFKTSSGQSQPTVIDKIEHLPIFQLLPNLQGKPPVKAPEPAPAQQQPPVRKEFLASLRNMNESVSLEEITAYLQSRDVTCITENELVHKTQPTVRFAVLPHGDIAAFVLNPTTQKIHYYDPSGTSLSQREGLEKWAQNLATDGWSIQEDAPNMTIPSLADHHRSFFVLQKIEETLFNRSEFDPSDNSSVESARRAYAARLDSMADSP